MDHMFCHYEIGRRTFVEPHFCDKWLVGFQN